MQTEKQPDEAVIVAENGEQFPADVYEETSRACYDSQRQVSNAWAAGKLPTHNPAGAACKLYSSPNFQAYQYPDGHGIVKHYAVRETVRSRHGVIMHNTDCYGRGWAYCSPPSSRKFDVHSLSLSALVSSMDGTPPGWRDVRSIEQPEDVARGDYKLVEAAPPSSDTVYAFAADRDTAEGPLAPGQVEDIFGEVD